MGGPASGNIYHWHRPPAKTRVEECLSIDVNLWMRERILQPHNTNAGRWIWTDSRGHENSISYLVNTLDPAQPFLVLQYWGKWQSPQRELVVQRVRLATTQPQFGGQRWWFICPLLIRGQPCQRRVGKLYLPPGARYFGCRHCDNLTYRSCQESHKWDALFRRFGRDLGLDFEATKETMAGLAERWRSGTR